MNTAAGAAQAALYGYGTGLPQIIKRGGKSWRILPDGAKIPIGQAVSNGAKLGKYADIADKAGTGLTVVGGVASGVSGYIGARDSGHSVGASAAIGTQEAVGDTAISMVTVSNFTAAGIIITCALGNPELAPVGAAVGALIGVGVSIFASNAFNDEATKVTDFFSNLF